MRWAPFTLIDAAVAETHEDMKPGAYVCLIVEDDGKGMDEETRRRMFEPFFTTKFQGRGLGMAAAYGIIKNHEGWISVASESGEGTRVLVCLPAVESSPDQAEKPRAGIVRGTETILLVEDEPMVFEMEKVMLERLGYRVLGAKTGSAAIETAAAFDGPIDLALLDLILPDMKGGEVYTGLMKARPGLKVIVCSGFSIEGPAQEALDAGAQGFLQKPFSIARLSERLRDVIDAPVKS